MAQRKFRNPENPSGTKLQRLLVEGPADELAEALVGLALNGPLAEAYEVLTRPSVTEHADPGVRGAAVLSLGHLARRYRELPIEPTRSLISKALADSDSWVRGQAENAKSDMEVYAPQVLK